MCCPQCRPVHNLAIHIDGQKIHAARYHSGTPQYNPRPGEERSALCNVRIRDVVSEEPFQPHAEGFCKRCSISPGLERTSIEQMKMPV